MTGHSLPPAIVLGGSYNAVSVARSLSRLGVEVSAIGNGTSSIRYSRHCASFEDLGTGSGVQERWMEWLTRTRSGAVLLPCDDDALELIARNRSRLLALGYRPFEADDEVLLAMLDKDETYRLARRIGVASPLTAAVRTETDLQDLQDLRFPCALKPIHSHVFAHKFGRSLKAFTVNSRGELDALLAELLELGIEMLVTEIVPGAEDQFGGYYAYMEDGEPLFELTKRKLRQYPPVFGMGCYHVTTHDAEVAEVGLRFLRGVGARGLANVEVKRDERDGELKLIECNHRFTAINELLRLAGVDVAAYTYSRLAGVPVDPPGEYRDGVRLWYPFQDSRAALAMMRSGTLSLGQWMRSIGHRQHMPLFEISDPLPTLGLGQARLRRRVARAVRGRARAAAQPA